MAVLRSLLIILFCSLVVSGCATRQKFEKVAVPEDRMKNILQEKPSELRPAYRRLLVEGRRNRVLNNMKLGLDALQFGHEQEAIAAFEKATQGISTIYADNEDAAKARSLWYEEGQKDFKGEPYERAMAFFYLGLLDMMRGDFENSRASFMQGALQDAFVEEDQNRCDFATLYFMEGWASQMDGDTDLAGEAYKIVQEFRPDFTIPTDENVLFLVELGKSPRKVSDGPGHSELKFRRGKGFMEYRAEIAIDDGAFVEMFPMEDLYWQAATRGGRPVDKILEGKAVFRSKNERIGTTLSKVSDEILTASTMMTDVPVVMGVGAALGLVSVTHMALAARSRAHADTRYWDNLPESLHVYTARLAPGEHTVQLKFRDRFGRELPHMARQTTVQVVDDTLPVVWLRSRMEPSRDLTY